VKFVNCPGEFRQSALTPNQTLASYAMQGRRILLAEDGPDNQRLITFFLEKTGAEVTVAANGQTAYDLVWTAHTMGAPFDVVLMDMQMPVLDGYSAARKLRNAGYPGPIIAITAHAMKADRDRCLSAGCDDYTTKPIDRATLLSLVAQYARRRQPSDRSGPRQSALPAKDG
jgi:CheY-like chemotaxis protein